MHYEGFIPLAIGIYASLLGFGVVTLNADPEKNRLWLEKHGLLLKICGPASAVFGVLQVFQLLR